MNPKLGEYCKNANIPWIPGCGTVTEVFFAQELGAELVKIYPANVLTQISLKRYMRYFQTWRLSQQEEWSRMQ